MIAVKRALSHRSRRKLAEHTAATYGVTVEHLLETLRNRQAFRAARFYRRRSRKRSLRNNPKAIARPMIGAKYAAEGPLYTMMRVLGLSVADFCEITGVHRKTVETWCSWPLLRWPVRFLECWAEKRAMEEYLRARGVDLEQFKLKLPEQHRIGQYPRKRGDMDLDKLPLGTYSPLDRF